MTAQKIISDGLIDLADILFENRNKAYGAYDLRKHYDERMNKSMLITLSVFILVFLLALAFISHSNQSLTLTGLTGKPDITTHNIKFPINNPPPPSTKTATTPITKTKINPNKADFRVVDKTNIPLLKPDSIKSSSPLTTIGSPTTGGTGLTTPSSNGLQPQVGTNTTTPAIPVIVPTLKFAQFMPQFPGGDDALQNYLKNHIKFTNAAINNHAEGQIFISFIIDVDGTAENIKVVHDNMGYGCAQNAIDVIKNMPTWTPASDNGHQVRVEMVLPITYKTF